MPRNCLIVVDMLNDYIDQREPDTAVRLISKTNELIAAFREAGCPVVWIRQAFKPDLSDAFLEMRDKRIAITIDGTSGAEIHGDLARLPTDLVITKKRYSAFFGTSLDDHLGRLGLTHITLAGVNTHACIRMAAIDAYQRDMRVTIAVECVDSGDSEHARISLDYMKDKIALVSTNDVIADSLR